MLYLNKVFTKLFLKYGTHKLPLYNNLCCVFVIFNVFWTYTGWIIKKTSQIFSFWKHTCSKPRQNCFGSWVEHCVHCTYLSHQWRHSRRHWEILDEEGTLLQSLYQKVTFQQSGCTIQDPVSQKSWWWASEFLGIEKLILSFSLIYRKQKLTRTVTLICCSLLPECRRCYPGNDFEFLQDSFLSHSAKVTQQFLRQNTPDVIAADEWASYFPDLNPLDYCTWDILQDLLYEGRQLQFASHGTWKRQWKTNGRSSPLRQFENLLQNGKMTECG